MLSIFAQISKTFRPRLAKLASALYGAYILLRSSLKLVVQYRAVIIVIDTIILRISVEMIEIYKIRCELLLKFLLIDYFI